jgi:Spy/CpxP family protein refolding chaperone
MSVRNAVITIVLGLVAGVAGMWIGRQAFAGPDKFDGSLHGMVHKGLSLTPEQNQSLDALETAFAARRTILENEMRIANAELAAAIRSSETAGPEVEAAVHHFHDAMGALQTETIDHVFAMRRVLTPEQRAKFDDRIAQALTTDAQ